MQQKLRKEGKMENWLILIVRTIIGFTLLLIATKLMGKREIGQLSVFDFLIVLSVADIMIIGIENFDESMLLFIIPMVIIVVLQKIIALIGLKSPWVRDKMDGKESLIIKKGKIQIDAMKKEKYNMNDLYTQLREKGVKSIDEVEYAILENNGRLSVFTYKDKDNETFPLPLIISGKIEKDNLKLIEKSEDWLLEMLKKQNIDNFENIYGASYQDGKIKVVLSDKKEVK